MSKNKDKARAKTFIYRNGVKLSVAQLKREEEDRRLGKLGLSRGKARLVTPEEDRKERRDRNVLLR